MKNYYSQFGLGLAVCTFIVTGSCKKDSVPTSGTTTTEEFQQVYNLPLKGWIIKDNTVSASGATATWSQGVSGPDKYGNTYGFDAFSYKSSSDEYAYSGISGLDSNASISSWLVTPTLTVKNGDKFSFYTRGDAGSFTDRMQVLMNHSAKADVAGAPGFVGEFTDTLFDINASQIPGGYPQSWTKYEYSFTGMPQKTELHIAFRHFVDSPVNARGVGLDLFQMVNK